MSGWPGESLLEAMARGELGPLEKCLLLIAGFAILYLSCFLHELGHALLGRWAGFRVTSFGLGVGRPVWAGGCRGTRVYLARNNPFQGITFVYTLRNGPFRTGTVAMLAGGAAAHAILVGVALLLWRLFPRWDAVWLLAVVLNG